MKVYVSADIEGIAGVSSWDEATASHPAYPAMRDRMTEHVAACCAGAVDAGANEIWVKDAHATGRNVIADRLPREARLIRGWSHHPFSMVQEIEDSFDAACFVGYHARAGSGGNPLAHTLSSSKVARIEVNGRSVAEFHLFAWAAASVGVPVVMVSGDEAVCADVRAENEAIVTVPVMRGVGDSTVSIHPAEAAERIREGARTALLGDVSQCLLTPPEPLDLRVRFVRAERAYWASWYPGAHLVDDHTIELRAKTYFDALRGLSFVV